MAAFIHPATTSTIAPSLLSNNPIRSPSTPLLQYPRKPPCPPPPPPPSLSSPVLLKPSISPSKSKLSLTRSSSTSQFLTNPPLSPPKEQPHLLPFPSNQTIPWIYDLCRLLRTSVSHSDAAVARAVHASILKAEENTHLENALIAAYFKLRLDEDARNVFLSLSTRDVVSYTTLVSAFAKSNRELEAVALFFDMRNAGIEPNEFSFVAILTACNRIVELNLGFQVHAMATKLGYMNSTFVANALMSLYCKGGCLDFLLRVFDEMPKRDIVSWNTVITSLVKERMFHEAFELFRGMQDTDKLEADYLTLSTLLMAASGSFSVKGGSEIHAHALRLDLGSNLSVNNALITFYSRCGKVENVVGLFERMPEKDVFTWTEMVTAYMAFGLVDQATQIFNEMHERNSVSYNALLAGFCQNGEASRAVKLFLEMLEECVELTDSTLTSVVKACGLLMEARLSEQIHGLIVKCGCGSNACIEAALLDMCTRCGRMVDAQKMFQKWPFHKDSCMVLSSMMCGHARNGDPDKAFCLLCSTVSEETMEIDQIASTVVLSICGTLCAKKMGEQIHCHVVKSGFLIDLAVGNALLSMYAKCGDMGHARKVFDCMLSRDIVSWNSFIAGCLLHRKGDEALAAWSEMEGIVEPDEFTFVLIITAYKYTDSNSVDKCFKLLGSMKGVYGIAPTSEHYASLVSVLGSWGLLEEVREVLLKMSPKPDASVWRALLDSRRISLNTDLGQWAAKSILALEPHDPAMHILASNLYSASGRWHCSERVRQDMREKGFKKIPGRCWIVHQNKVHYFYSRDKSHPESKDIHSGLEILVLECLKAGYVPDTSFVLHEVEEHHKNNFLFYHSAKLAITYALLMTKRGQPICVVKNIRLCGDCHTFFKYVSLVTKRDISLRDTSGFHVFANGQCSCRDRW